MLRPWRLVLPWPQRRPTLSCAAVRDPTEDELDGWMDRLAQGEREAFDPLFRALYPRSLRLARARLPGDQAADAAQAILMKIFAHASDFEPGKPMLPWFYAIAANELRATRRKNASQEARSAPEEDAARLRAADDPERLFLERELQRSIAGAIAELDDTSAKAIASLLDEQPCIDVGAAAFRKRVSRAYARLRLLLGGL
jgi:RNA polymerase sigma factor (sigma-70 family)